MTISNDRTILVRSGLISFHTTAGQIKEGVGNYSTFNAACKKALDEVEARLAVDVAPRETRGVVGAFNGMHIQLDLM